MGLREIWKTYDASVILPVRLQ